MTDHAISDSILACLARFHEFLQATRVPQARTLEQNEIEAWQDEQGRLQVWAKDVGAPRKGLSSLRVRLRDSSHIREETTKLLGTLEQFLVDARSLLTEPENPESVYVDEVDEGEDSEVPTEIQELRESIASIIRYLFRMSVLIRDPAPHDFLLASGGDLSVAAFAEFDRRYVVDKLLRAGTELTARLARAITRRRSYFKYREGFNVTQSPETETVPTEQQSQHEEDDFAESIAYASTATVTTESTAWSATFTDLDMDIESGVSQTSFASSALFSSKTSIPSPPRGFYRSRFFECPYCYCNITGGSTRMWIAHLFQDLQPYICLEMECVVPSKLYASKHRWLQHIKIAHPGSHLTRNDRATILNTDCSLCMETSRAGTPYARHIARHLQELALFALPRKQDDDDLSEEAPFESSQASGSSSDLSNLAERRSEEIPVNPEIAAKLDSLDTSYSTNLADKVKSLLVPNERRYEETVEAQGLIEKLKVDVLAPLSQIDRDANSGLVEKIDSLESRVRGNLRALGLLYVAS